MFYFSIKLHSIRPDRILYFKGAYTRMRKFNITYTLLSRMREIHLLEQTALVILAETPKEFLLVPEHQLVWTFCHTGLQSYLPVLLG